MDFKISSIIKKRPLAYLDTCIHYHGYHFADLMFYSESAETSIGDSIQTLPLWVVLITNRKQSNVQKLSVISAWLTATEVMDSKQRNFTGKTICNITCHIVVLICKLSAGYTPLLNHSMLNLKIIQQKIQYPLSMLPQTGLL